MISCALALLAVQPAMGTGAVGKEPRRGVVLEGVMTGGETGLKESAARPVRGPRTTGATKSMPQVDPWLGSARKLHILATVEILQRLLMGELRNTQMQVAAGIWIDDICIGIAVVPLQVKGGEEWTAEYLPMRERQFAIAHCLLAPPVC